MSWGLVLRNKSNKSRIYRILSDLPASIPNYLDYQAKQDEELARAIASFIRSFGRVEITDSEYYHFATIMHNQGVLNEKDYKSVTSSILRLIYKNFYLYLGRIDLKALKEDCTFSMVRKICDEDWTDDINYLLKFNLIDEEAHVSNTCKVITEGKVINYITCIKRALSANKPATLVFQLCVEINEDETYRRSISIVGNHDSILLQEILKLTILDMSIHSSRSKKYAAIQKLATFGNSASEFLYDTSEDPVYSYLKHEILKQLPDMYTSIGGVRSNEKAGKLSVLAAFRELPPMDRIHHYSRVLRDKDEEDSFKTSVFNELRSSAYLAAGGLLLSEHRISGHSKTANSALQIWCNKNPYLASELFNSQKGLHKKSELIRIVAASSIIGSIKTLLVILSKSPSNDTIAIVDHIKGNLPTRSREDKNAIEKFILELTDSLESDFSNQDTDIVPTNVLSTSLFVDNTKVLQGLKDIRALC